MYPTASVPHAQPIRFAGSVLNANRHVCGFFRTPEEEYGLLLPFIKEGIDRGEKTINVVAPANREDHLRRLSSCGIDVTATAQSGQLEVHSWEELYFPDGCFDQERMLAMWQDVLAAAGLKGYARTRLVAHMEWALEEREGVSDLLEYEARCDAWFNTVPQNERHPVICAYDLTKFSADVIIDVLRTHPMVIVGGVLQENPFYIPPHQFLQELRVRRARQGAPVEAALN